MRECISLRWRYIQECISFRWRYIQECISFRWRYIQECISLRWQYLQECISLRWRYIQECISLRWTVHTAVHIFEMTVHTGVHIFEMAVHSASRSLRWQYIQGCLSLLAWFYKLLEGNHSTVTSDKYKLWLCALVHKMPNGRCDHLNSWWNVQKLNSFIALLAATIYFLMMFARRRTKWRRHRVSVLQ